VYTGLAMSCLFCKIASGEIPSAAIYQDERVYAFADINPKAPVHVLIVPREHITSLAEANEEQNACLVICCGPRRRLPARRASRTATALW
jgi:galactose-1-phosphate uridylyltransferase